MKTTDSTKPVKTLPATLHHYYFDASKPEESAKWTELCKQMRAEFDAGTRGHKMHAFGEKAPLYRNDSEAVDIELAHLFENQWNTGPTDSSAQGLRVFDFYQFAEIHSKNIKRGHWLELSPELIQARRETHKCGYCGAHYGPHHEPIPSNGFCSKCLGSEYLKQSELYLLRLIPLSPDSYDADREKHRNDRPQLNAEEAATLVPQWQEMRRTCDLKRASAARVRERQQIEKKLTDYKRELEANAAGAQEEHDGMLWLWEHGFSTENWIYYKHTRTFAWGWRTPVSAEDKSRWLEIASEFPFNYEVKSVAGNVERKNEA